jgi:flagellar protein FliT
MSEDAVIFAYEGLSRLTGRMLEAAKAGEWDTVVALESDYSRQVQTLPVVDATAALSPETREHKVRLIHTILAHDREIRDLASPWMAHLSALISNSGNRRKLAAYGGGTPL